MVTEKDAASTASSGEVADQRRWGYGAIAAWSVGRGEDAGDRRSPASGTGKGRNGGAYPEIELFFQEIEFRGV